MQCYLIVFNFLIMVLVVRCVYSTSCDSGTYGREFYFGILESIDDCCHDTGNKVRVDITNVSPKDADVRVQIPFDYIDRTITIPVGTRQTVEMSPLIQQNNDNVIPFGIGISSNNLVSVMVTNAFRNGYTMDSYNILPVNSIGNDYIIASYNNPHSNRGSEIRIAGVYNKTNVKMYDGAKVIFSVELNIFDVFQYRLKTNNVDLTGFRLTSDKNVSVTAGASHVQIPTGHMGADFIATELYPINTMSNAYIVPPILPKRRFILRIQSEVMTKVVITNGTQQLTVNSSTSDHYFGSKPVTITADKPLLVSQYGLSYEVDSFGGDPFMTVVPGINQYVNELTFSVPDELYTAKPYLNIIVPKIYVTDLRLDSKNIPSNVTSQEVPVPYDSYTVLSFPTTSGVHHIYHPMKDAKFCVLVIETGTWSGHAGSLSAGFYPGYNLNGGCSSQELTTTGTPNTSTKTTIPDLTTHHSTNASGKHVVQCYHCEDMTHTELCDTIKTCGTSEECLIERYIKSGRFVYRSGCLTKAVCERQQSVHTPDVCVECCHDDYCNNKGCGDIGLPDRPQRGPVCFDCQHVLSPDECTTVTLCDTYQVCSVEEFTWGDHSHFKMGCSQQMCDPLKRSVLHMMDRATPICHSCCEQDYCNKNCTRTTHGPDILIG